MMKTYLLGDLHGSIDFNSIYRYGPHPNDRLIQLGDFGLVFQPAATQDENRQLYELGEFWGEVLFVDGNHENFPRLAKFPVREMYGGKVRQLAHKVYQLMRGEVYNIDGQTFFVMGGGDSIDKNRRIEGISWWAEEQPSMEEQYYGYDNLDKVGWKVDYVLTHTCPMKTKLHLLQKMHLVNSSDHLENYLENVRAQLDYKRWYFGHFHIDADLPDRMTTLYHMLVELGETVDPEDDDFISGMYGASQTEELPPLASTKNEVLAQMKAEYLGYSWDDDGEFHQTKIIGDPEE